MQNHKIDAMYNSFANYCSFLFTTIILMLIIAPLVRPKKLDYRSMEKKILDDILKGSGKYDKRIRPSGRNVTDGPAVISVNMFLRSITEIDDVKMEFTVQMSFREKWFDDRLIFDNKLGRISFLTLTDMTKIWMPDLFFSNEKSGHYHNIILPNVMIRIYPSGQVLISIRITLVLACPMNLKYYPLDKQVCSIRMPSYGYTTDDMVFVWDEKTPVQVTKDLRLPRFTLESYRTSYCISNTTTGVYPCLFVHLIFKREFSYYLIQIYIPCCMLVIVSWVSFWLDQNAIPARVSLGVTTLLTMATQTSSINSSLPPVSYTKAIDVWTGVCLTFVFSALLEFALVNYASRNDVSNNPNKSPHNWDLEHSNIEVTDHLEDGPTTFAMKPLMRHTGPSGEKVRECEVHMQPRTNIMNKWMCKFSSRSKRIDVISRICFPLVFALFNLVYWSTYLFRSNSSDHLKMN